MNRKTRETMIVHKRVFRRNGATIVCLIILAFLLFYRYGSRVGGAFKKFEDDGVGNEITASLREADRESIEHKGTIRGRNDVHVDWQRIDKNPLESEENCNLDTKSQIFGSEDGGYETIRMSLKEIYSDDFTYLPSEVKPIISDPDIRLHPDKFLFPVLMRGPNNQLVGLREAVYVAIRLNRTIVIPRFIKHRTDSQLDGINAIHPVHRVDFEILCKFVSCITMQQFRRACGNQVDVIFRLRYYSSKRIADMESFTGLRFSDVPDERKKILNFLPKPKGKKKKKEEVYFGPNPKEITALFSTEDRCAVYPLPFYNLKIRAKPSKKKFSKQSDLAKMKDTEVYSEVIRHTTPPKYIRDISENFIQVVFGGQKFLSVHWRYDRKDWMKRCKTLDKDSDRKKRCDEAANMRPSDVARAILNKLKELKTDLAEITSVYIASPPSEMEFIKEIKKILNAENLAAYHLEDLIIFLKQRYGSCKFLWDRADDIESTIEMRICAKGMAFLKSSRSSWSSNVKDWRRHNKENETNSDKDDDIFLLTRKEKEIDDET